jgi:hypothetical protein
MRAETKRKEETERVGNQQRNRVRLLHCVFAWYTVFVTFLECYFLGKTGEICISTLSVKKLEPWAFFLNSQF